MTKFKFTLLLIILTNTLNAQFKVLSLNQLNKRIATGKDTTYVVNLWATWCAPCVEELPYFERIHRENLNKPIKVILLSLDFKSKLNSDIVPFVIKNKLSTEVFVIDEPNQQTFNKLMHKDWTGVLPTTLFVNTKNKIKVLHEKTFTFQELEKTLSALH